MMQPIQRAATVNAAARTSGGARDTHGRFVRATAEPVVVPTPRGSATRTGGAVAYPSGRAQDGLGGRGLGVLSKISQTLDGIGGAVGKADQIDPTVAAMKEVRDVVSPVGRGAVSLVQRLAERRKERWYERILKALLALKKPAETTQVQSGFLSGRGIGGGVLGSIAGLAGSMLGKGGGLLMKGSGLLGGLLGKGAGLLGRGGKFLRRIPVLGALMAGGGALATVLGDGTREEKFKGVGEAGGMLAGGFAGAKAGAMLGAFAGPIGIAVGGFLGGVGGALFGEVVGAKVGEWTQTLVDSDIPGQLVSAWNVTTTAVGAAWESLSNDMRESWGAITDKASSWWESTKSTAAGINDWFKSKTGVDVGETISDAASSAWDKMKSAAASGWSAAKGYAGQAGDAALAAGSAIVPKTVKRAVSAASQAVSAMGSAATSGIGEVLQTGPGFNVTRNADGSITRQEGARNWRNNNPGNLEYGDFAKSMGAIGTDGRFAVFPDYATGRKAKESLIFESKGYRDLSLTDAIKRYAPPTENNTGAYQRTVLSSVGANRKMSDYSPTERSAILDAMQRVEGFKPGTVSVAGGVAAPDIRPAAAATVATDSFIPMRSASVPMPVPDRMPTFQVPKIPERLNTGGQAPASVVIRGDVGQDVSDRTIAHVVTGGLGGKQ